MTNHVWLFTLLAILVPLLVVIAALYMFRVVEQTPRNARIRRSVAFTVAAAYVYAAITIQDVPQSRMIWYLLAAVAWATLGYFFNREQKR